MTLLWKQSIKCPIGAKPIHTKYHIETRYVNHKKIKFQILVQYDSSKFRHTRSSETNLPTGVSTVSVEPKQSTSKSKANANADDMSEWYAPVSKRIVALELNTSNVPWITDGSCNTLYFPIVRTHTCIYEYPTLSYTLYFDLLWNPIQFHKHLAYFTIESIKPSLNRFIIESIHLIWIVQYHRPIEPIQLSPNRFTQNRL